MACPCTSTGPPAATADDFQQDSLPLRVQEQILATIYGQCIGDAIGLLTEFLEKDAAEKAYGKNPKDLRYDQKISDYHRVHWDAGDWTDDSDQMFLILQSLLYNKGQIVPTDFAMRMRRWMKKGFPELGDDGGCGIGETTYSVLSHPEFTKNPAKVAEHVWVLGLRNLAPNGGVMRTSILGLHQWDDVEKVIENALAICTCTHRDPRCQASVVAVSSCISLMLQHTMAHKDKKKPKKMDVDNLIKQSYDYACRVLETPKQKEELWKFMSCKKIQELELSDSTIGYTYKCMGTGFWALKQDDFKKAMIAVVMEAGDADTNGAVAGSLLACKLGVGSIPTHWIDDLLNKSWLMDMYQRFLRLQTEMKLPVEDRTANDDQSIENLDLLAEKLSEQPEEK